jgi:hypothetical protein
MIFPILFFLILQVFIHGEKWKAGDWISKQEKTAWAIIRLFIFFLFSAFYVTLKEQGPCYLSEVTRVFLFQNFIFWASFDILLPVYAGKPQLWQDPSLQDNNSPFDRLGGSWQMNILIKAAGIVGVAYWMIQTEPNELIPNIVLNLELLLHF